MCSIRLLSFILIFTPSLALADDNAKAIAAFKRGFDHANAGEYDKAIEAYTEA